MTKFSFEAHKLYERQEQIVRWQYYKTLIPHYLSRVMILFMLCTLLIFFGAYYNLHNSLTLAGGPIPSDMIEKYFRIFDRNNYIYVVEPIIRQVNPRIPENVYRTDYLTIVDWFTQKALYKTQNILINLSLYISLPCSLIGAWWNLRRKIQKERSNERDRNFIRGAKLLSPKKIIESAKKLPAILRVGQIPIPVTTETKHVLTFGASGSGKSVLLSQWINQICCDRRDRKSQRRFILVDVKPEFVGKFYENGDFIFCPFDKRSVNWNLFNEIRDDYDFQAFSTTLFTDNKTYDPFWPQSAATVFSDVLKSLYAKNQRTNKALCKIFQQSPEEITNFITNTLDTSQIISMQSLTANENTKSSIFTTISPKLRPFQIMGDPQGELFSFRKYIRGEYVRQDGTQPNLYLIIPADRVELMTPLITLVTDIMFREVLSLPEDKNRRIYFILDELGALNKLPTLPDLIVKGRSYGAVILALSQDAGMITEKYGPHVLESFLNNFGTQIFLRINNAETSRKLSQSLGEYDFYEYSISPQKDDAGKSTISYTRSQKTQALVTPSQIQSLPTFHGFMKIADLGTTPCIIPQKFFNATQPHYIPREIPLTLSNMSNEVEIKNERVQDTKCEHIHTPSTVLELITTEEQKKRREELNRRRREILRYKRNSSITNSSANSGDD